MISKNTSRIVGSIRRLRNRMTSSSFSMYSLRSSGKMPRRSRITRRTMILRSNSGRTPALLTLAMVSLASQYQPWVHTHQAWLKYRSWCTSLTTHHYHRLYTLVFINCLLDTTKKHKVQTLKGDGVVLFGVDGYWLEVGEIQNFGSLRATPSLLESENIQSLNELEACRGTGNFLELVVHWLLNDIMKDLVHDLRMKSEDLNVHQSIWYALLWSAWYLLWYGTVLLWPYLRF